MTSLAIFPPLKRTITEIMDEELYHLPNSPIQFSNSQQSQPSSQLITQQHIQRADSPNPLFRNTSVSSSPALNNSQLYSNNTNLSNLLNIPDSFVEQYTRNSNSSNNFAMDVMTVNDDFYNNHNNSNQMKTNPFNEYGNPDTQIFPFIKPQDLQNQQSTFNRRRITTLDTSDNNQKSLKDEDYLLFNPDIQPSQLFSNKFNDDYSESSLFVPNQPSNLNNYPIPGYENDYLLVDDFDEEDEEELSDDEDDNYFYEDGDFDEITTNDFMDMDNYFKPSNKKESEELFGGYVDDYGVNNADINVSEGEAEDEDDDNSMMIDGDIETEETSPIEFYEEESISPAPRMKKESNNHRLDTQHHKTAAEISANNPNHQCDLINPSTGQPCNKQFSRPYDLIRHQETIHATKKKIFRCVICEGRLNGGAGNGKSKTFSRGDALSRHIKVKHGLVGKDALDIINEAKENVEYVYV